MDVFEIVSVSDFPQMGSTVGDRQGYLEQYFDEVRKNIADRITKNNIRVLSFDVFDTFLLRNNKSEARRYWEMSVSIHNEISANRDLYLKDGNVPTVFDLVMARAEGMKMTYRTRPPVSGCVEGDIREVYRLMVDTMKLSDVALEMLEDIEVKYEINNLIVNEPFAAVAREVRGQGVKVILLSDMYLPADIIDRIATEKFHQNDKLYDRIFSSCDMVVSKRSGKIFKVVEEELREVGAGFLHIGDSLVGDVYRPADEGWLSMHFPISSSEINDRQTCLSNFIREMDDNGINVKDWAKV